MNKSSPEADHILGADEVLFALGYLGAALGLSATLEEVMRVCYEASKRNAKREKKHQRANRRVQP